MTATAAEALEVALWLHRAPSRRAALLDRPLPAGIGQLLRVAGGSREQVAAAALVTGESEETVLEAVRFYLQQVLFHEHADAYRVLGLRPGAPHEQAREHHRLLQHWLHPDRRGSDEWDSVYAGRVNRAWTQLRSPQARAAYQAAFNTSSMVAPSAGMRRPSGEVLAAASVRPVAAAPHRSRNLALVVLVGCVGLLIALAMQQDAPPEWRDAGIEPGGGPSRAATTVADGAVLLDTLATLRVGASAATPPTSSLSAARAESVAVVAPPEEELGRPASVSAPPTNRRAAPAPTPPPPEPPVGPRLAPEPPPIPAAAPAQPPPVNAAPPKMSTAALAPVPDGAQAQPVPDALARMAEARRRAGEVLAYLGERDAVQPPVWNDLAAARQAARLRAAMLERLPTGSRVALRDPHWRLSPDGARLVSGYRAAVDGGLDEDGRIALDFTWRQDRLLVRSMTLEPDR